MPVMSVATLRSVPDLDLVPITVAAPGSYPPGELTYSSIAAFVREDRARLRSPELDLGLHWRDRGELYRAAWIEETGEVYVVQLGAPEQGGGHVELLAARLSPEGLETALRGWREAHDRCELQWLRDRLASGAARASD
jgi:hypothetical protein